MQFSDHIARRMKLHDLHILMAVAQAGSMNKAAALLNMTQSAVSRSVAELERTVGVSLLDRYPRGVKPTEYGRALLDCGVAVLMTCARASITSGFSPTLRPGKYELGAAPFSPGASCLPSSSVSPSVIRE